MGSKEQHAHVLQRAIDPTHIRDMADIAEGVSGGHDATPALAQVDSSLLATAVEQVAETIMITDTDGRIEYVNSAFTRLTGYGVDEVIGKKTSLLKSGQQKPEYYRDLWNTILAGKTWKGALINRRKDGTLYTEEMTIAPVRNSRGAITNFVAIKQDISQRNWPTRL